MPVNTFLTNTIKHRMRAKFLIPSALGVLALGIFLFTRPEKEPSQEPEGERDRESKAYVEGRMAYELSMLKDPATGKIPRGIFKMEKDFVATLPVRGEGKGDEVLNLNDYIPVGPNNIGGRTRAVAYDRRYDGSTNRIIIAGCVSGGIMRSDNGGQTWALVTPQNDIHSFTSIVQDPRTGFQNTWYAAGGEFSGNSASANGASYLGFGIWKSINNGLSWTKLPLIITDINGNTFGTGLLEQFDHPFDMVYRLAVNPINGALYIAGFRRLVRSLDGGASFQAVFGNSTPTNSSHAQMDISFASDGLLYLAVNGGHPDPTLRGIFTSTTGNAGSFIRIAGGQTLGVDSIPGWRGNSPLVSSKRVLIDIAPSNNNIGYVFYQNGLSSDAPQLQPEADLFQFTKSGSTYTWSNRSANMPDFPGGNLSNSDPLSVQGGYDMLVRIKPNNPNTVYIGGTNLYRSTDGFSSTNNTAWIGGYNTNFSYQSYPASHPDMHELVFNPSNPDVAISGNDGGVQEANVAQNAVNWAMLPNYQTLQCYYVAIDPDAGRNNYASGSQDNGVRLRDRMGLLNTAPADSNNHLQIFSADGNAVGISRLDINSQIQYLYGGYQLGNIFRYRLAPGNNAISIRPNGLTTNPQYGPSSWGEFVTNFRLNPDNTEDLYYVNFNRLFRTTTASSVTAGGWTELTGVGTTIGTGAFTGANSIRAISFSRGPYLSTHALYLGTTNGKIYRLDDPRNSSTGTGPVDITPTGLIGNVQDISVNPNNDEEIMAVVTNFGVTSGGQLQNITNIWWTNNAKSANPNWVQAEGNLSLGFISARTCAIIVKKDAANNPVTEYYVGTGAGLLSVQNLGTTLLAGGSPVWVREGVEDFNWAVIQHMVYRPYDNVLLLGTHGNGMYVANLGTPNFTPPTGTAITPVTNDKRFITLVAPTLTRSKVQYQVGTMPGINSIQVLVSDMQGRTVQSLQKSYSSGDINFSSLPAGTYVVNIISNNGRYRHIQKIVKQ